MEHKTASEDIGLGSVFWKRLRLDAQASNYIAGARALGFEPDGVLYDVLRKPALRPLEVNSKRSVAETPEEYGKRCLADILEKPDYYFQRGTVVRLESEERDAAFDTWQVADQIRQSRNLERWPRNVDSCAPYGRMCGYWSVCSGEAQLEDPALFEATEIHPELEGKHRLPLLTSSSARTYRACARRYFFAYETARRPRAKAGSLHIGSLVHKGLEAWMNGGYDLDAALSAMTSSGDSTHDDAKAKAMMCGYHARWSGEPLEIVAVEKEFTAPLLNPETGAASRTFERGGKLDAIVRKAD
jgi:PD-(D/E)XK nuclease superfamily